MKILLCNDDGYQAPGINMLEKVLSTIAEVVVVAPDRNRSGASNSLTLDRPLNVRKYKSNGHYVNGTPTDCVHMAIGGLFDDFKPDMVISGINDGANLGDDILYSGTVAAAIQGRFLGFPAIAVSLNDPAEHYETAANITLKLVKKMMSHNLPASTILNVNVPDIPEDQLLGHEVTRLGTRHCSESLVKEQDPRGRDIYWIGLPGAEHDAGPGTDFYAIRSNNVSITPLTMDLTNYVAFEKLSGWVDDLETGE